MHPECVMAAGQVGIMCYVWDDGLTDVTRRHPAYFVVTFSVILHNLIHKFKT